MSASPINDSYDSIIIGAGFSGLSAGVMLSQFQKKVLIIENHHVPGGLNSYYTKDKEFFSPGLHTVTNFNITGRRWGLGLICRNLSIKPDVFNIYRPKFNSKISFPDITISFGNDTEVLRQSVKDFFPKEINNYDNLISKITEISTSNFAPDSNCLELLNSFIQDKKLIDLLLLPILSYAGYKKNYIDTRTFALLFRSLFLDGCGSPIDIKCILDLLLKTYKENGGEIIYKTTVNKIMHKDSIVTGVKLNNDKVLHSKYVLSSAGLYETGLLSEITCGVPGNISLFQLTACFKKGLTSMGINDPVHFISLNNKLSWGDNLDDIITIAASDSYQFPYEINKHHLKVSTFTDISHWKSLNKEDYNKMKETFSKRLLNIVKQFYPSFNENDIFLRDTFTPMTIKKFTNHTNGSIYGGKIKSFDGKTPIKKLFIIGNDQGGIGIMGAITSGILISNYNVILGNK